MQISKTNNVIFLKDVESNIIKEAFIVLKDNVRFENQQQESRVENTNRTIEILKEAELLINEEINKRNLNYEKYKLLKLQKKLKLQKLLNIFYIIAIIIFIIK